MKDITYIVIDQNGPNDEFMGAFKDLGQAVTLATALSYKTPEPWCPGYVLVFVFEAGQQMILDGKPYYYFDVKENKWNLEESYS